MPVLALEVVSPLEGYQLFNDEGGIWREHPIVPHRLCVYGVSSAYQHAGYMDFYCIKLTVLAQAPNEATFLALLESAALGLSCPPP